MSLPKYWTLADHERLQHAETYADLLVIAKDILIRMPKPVGQVCGPISTGGEHCMHENLDDLQEAITKLEGEGKTIFTQIPYQLQMQEIKKKDDEREQDLLTEFYLPLFESGLINTLYFLPDWETSVGSRWEHEQAKRLGMNIVYL